MKHNEAERILRETNDLAGAKHLVEVEGMSSPRVCNLLNQLVRSLDEDEHYLEIGTWKGRTLISAAYENQGKVCYACDKFRFWGKYTGWGHEVRRTFKSNVERYRDKLAKIHFFDMNSSALFKRNLVPAPVGVYFYDGGHSYRETYKGIEQAVPLLSRRSTLLVDDWNDPIIRRATYDALSDTKVKIMWSRYLEGTHDEQGFWNGLGVFYLQRG
jgi:hypothetical protein